MHHDDRRKYSELQVGSIVAGTPTYIDHNLMNSIFINESGLYSLIMRSKKQDARQFQQWVTKEVLPSIRKNGSYSLTSAQLAIEPPKYFTQEIEDIKKKKILVINNETSLHEQVVRFIRSNYPDAVIDGGLGELQHNDELRLEAYRKGYTRGKSDLIIQNHTCKYKGLVIEMKNPYGTGRLNDDQIKYLNNLKLLGFKTLVSNDYTQIILQINDYMNEVRINCPSCIKHFRNKITLSNHLNIFHRKSLHDI